MAAEKPDIQAIFNEAVARDSDEQCSQYLDEVCGDDPLVRERVEALLLAHSEAGGFFGGQPAATDIQSVTEKPGTVIGPYKLLQQIGDGGMGVVYMAEQKEPVKRRVALKIIKPGMDTQQVIARFEAERQALAMMDHPNIAKVLDARATDSGRPYFVMELVNGISVTQYCDEQHLTPKERLELFVPICQAVQHAHQKGIIHRDLKPSNVLVALYDGQAVPKVIDFGVAKATSQTLTEKTVFTQLGQIVGTLEYMSPEQAQRNQMDIDTRSDIYSLGVLLYELLTGNTPFDRKRLRSVAFDEMLRIIREEEPSKPSIKVTGSESLASIAANRKIEPAKLSVLVRGELDWIVMKALEKDRGRRYSTATSFAEDVQHYLNDEPVVACPPSAVYMLKKFARRNRGALTTASMIVLALLISVGSIGWMMRDRSVRQQQTAREQMARQAKIVGQIEFILEDFDRLMKERQWPKALAAVKRAEPLISTEECDDETRQRVGARLADVNLVQRLEDARLSGSRWSEGGFDYHDTDQAYERAFTEIGLSVESLTVEQAANQLAVHSAIVDEIATALTEWAPYRKKHTKKATADASWQHLVAVADTIDPDPWRRRLRAAWNTKDVGASTLRELSNSADVRSLSPRAVCLMARMLRDRASPDEAVELLQQAQRDNAADFWINFNLAQSLQMSTPKRSSDAVEFYRAALALRPENTAVLNNLGGALHNIGKNDEAIECYRRAIRFDPKMAIAYLNLGVVLNAVGKSGEAIECARKAIELNHRTAAAYNMIGNALEKTGKRDEALGLYRKSIDLQPDLAPPYVNLALALSRNRDFVEAIAVSQEGIKMAPNDARLYNGLGTALAKSGKRDEAIANFRKAVEVDATYEKAYANLGLTLRASGQYEAAIVNFNKAIELAPSTSSYYVDLANTFQVAGRFYEARASFEKSIEVDPKNAVGYNDLAWLLATHSETRQENHARAVKMALQAVRLRPEADSYLNTLGVAQYRDGDWKTSIATLEKSTKLRNGRDSIDNAIDWLFLSMSHWQLGQKDQARMWYDKAVGWMPENASKSPILQRFRAEAEQLLEITQPDGGGKETEHRES